MKCLTFTWEWSLFFNGGGICHKLLQLIKFTSSCPHPYGLPVRVCFFLLLFWEVKCCTCTICCIVSGTSALSYWEGRSALQAQVPDNLCCLQPASKLSVRSKMQIAKVILLWLCCCVKTAALKRFFLEILFLPVGNILENELKYMLYKISFCFFIRRLWDACEIFLLKLFQHLFLSKQIVCQWFLKKWHMWVWMQLLKCFQISNSRASCEVQNFHSGVKDGAMAYFPKNKPVFRQFLYHY